MVKVYLSNGYFEDLTENSREKGRKMIVKGFFGFVRNISAKKYFPKVVGGMRNQMIFPLRLELLKSFFRYIFDCV